MLCFTIPRDKLKCCVLQFLETSWNVVFYSSLGLVEMLLIVYARLFAALLTTVHYLCYRILYVTWMSHDTMHYLKFKYILCYFDATEI